MARPKKKMLALFPELLESTADLSNAQFGELMRAAFVYRFAGEPYNGGDIAVKIAFRFIASQVDRYEEQCQINSVNAKGGSAPKQSETAQKDAELSETERNRPHNHNHNHNRNHNPYIENEADKPPVCPRFIKPTMDEIRTYCAEQNLYATNPEAFFDYYESNGWKVGKNPMRNWKRALNNWDRRETERKKQSQPRTHGQELLDMIARGEFDE